MQKIIEEIREYVHSQWTLEEIREYVHSQWTLGKIHGISHWDRVYENGQRLLDSLGNS